MRSIDQGDAEEEEDHTVGGGAATMMSVAVVTSLRKAICACCLSPQHLDEILDGGVRFLGDVFKTIMGLDEATADEADDPGPVEQLGCHIREISHAEQSEWFNHCEEKVNIPAASHLPSLSSDVLTVHVSNMYKHLSHFILLIMRERKGCSAVPNIVQKDI